MSKAFPDTILVSCEIVFQGEKLRVQQVVDAHLYSDECVKTQVHHHIRLALADAILDRLGPLEFRAE